MKELSESRVLIVDDAPANIDILAQALRGDYQLSVATDGPEALQTAERLLPDLVLLDIVMPGINGYEVCRRLRACPATREIPVMFLSSLEDVQDKAKGFEAGGNDYVVKPFEILEVKARVRSLLRAKAYADSVKEKIAHELRIAREIQMGILPPDIAALSLGSGLEAHAILHPAQEVGGDLYDVLRTPEGNLVAVMGDVSGKGIPAALFMAITMTLVRALAPTAGRPEELLRRVNESLVSHNPRTMFVTLLCAVYDPSAGRLDYASAGHPPPSWSGRERRSFCPSRRAWLRASCRGCPRPPTACDFSRAIWWCFTPTASPRLSTRRGVPTEKPGCWMNYRGNLARPPRQPLGPSCAACGPSSATPLSQTISRC